MIFYGTTESERAAKSQGGNKELVFTLYTGSKNDSVPTLAVQAYKTRTGWTIDVVDLLHRRTVHTIEGIQKGEKQTGEACIECGYPNGNASHTCK